MYLYICVFLIYPTFVGSECNKVIVIIVIVSVSVVSRGFMPQPGHTKDHHKNVNNYLPAWQADIRVWVWLYSLID